MYVHAHIVVLRPIFFVLAQAHLQALAEDALV
jgi:hypothetical protein